MITITKGWTGPTLAPATIVHHPVHGHMRLMDVPEGDIVDVVCTDEGVPYCSADGLEEWAEYVATDSCGDTYQHEKRFPWLEILRWQNMGNMEEASEDYYHPGDWRESLYRVWRDK